jgi:hypothetical protein
MKRAIDALDGLHSNVEVDPKIAVLVGNVEPLNLRERANQVGHGIVVISDWR